MTERALSAATPRNTVGHMRGAVFFDGEARGAQLTRFWLLLPLAAVIATAGVVGDSDATVIGAMIVAPLMTPILGIMLAVVLTDRPNLVRSVVLVLAGAVTAVAIGYLVGLLVPSPVDAANNAQVASRVSPNLISLLAALATGAVGSVALVRSDISDTLPGVAVSISLVPPLTVVGLTLDAGQPGQAGGALVLFLTNVTAILAAGLVVMGLYRIHRPSAPADPVAAGTVNRRRAGLLVAAMIVVVAIPLARTSVSVSRDSARETSVQGAADAWGRQVGWQVLARHHPAGRGAGLPHRSSAHPRRQPATAGVAGRADRTRRRPTGRERAPRAGLHDPVLTVAVSGGRARGGPGACRPPSPSACRRRRRAGRYFIPQSGAISRFSAGTYGRARRIRAGDQLGRLDAHVARSMTPRMIFLPRSDSSTARSRFDCAVSIETWPAGSPASSGRNE